eukprot:TRINITY_DN15617_c0_g1_i1.p1 TRINITY_DN15617_c0_g1~~TRINITY_DN15617_c0_g1_i1.p1  ORF type:complete len:464 (-),score=47.00 TRINITY_DN15617_c0_g1_i1:322-1713(-)
MSAGQARGVDQCSAVLHVPLDHLEDTDPSCSTGGGFLLHSRPITVYGHSRVVSRGIVMMLLVMACLIAVCFKPGNGTWAMRGHSPTLLWSSYKIQIVDVLRFQGEHACGPQFANIAFKSNISWKDPSGVQSGAHCQRTCTWSEGCDGFTWSWGRGCNLMKFSNDSLAEFPASHEKGSYSGYACHQVASSYEWIYDEVEKHTLPIPEQGQPVPSASMLCLMVVRPYTYEIDLAIMQHQQGLGVFQCNYHRIYSNQLMQLADGLWTTKFNSTLYADIGGQWKTALNTDIFMALWRAVLTDADFLHASWIVKVDPDTVWFPNRLSPLVVEQEENNNTNGAGAYFQNCWEGMHGPIEVFSQNALRALALHSKQCYWEMNSWGNWQWGEDMWTDLCLKNTAFSHRIYKPKLLAEDHCNDKWEGWSLTPNACLSQDTIAFHPFKDAWHYNQCLQAAQQQNGDSSWMMKK